jgi:hypothetical protein
VSDVLRHLKRHGTVYDKAQAAPLTPQSIRRWEHFYDSLLPPKTPAELRVAYLAGPRPENDLEVLMSLGVLPENVWAFESDSSTYSDAVVSTLQSRFPFLKLFKGTTSAFLGLSSMRFDLVYLDFCGSILSRGSEQRNLHSIVSLLDRHALTSPGILITNSAFPTKSQDAIGFDLMTKLVACYLYPKEFTERDSGGGFIEGPIAHGLSFNEFCSLVQEKPGSYYGQFVTRLLVDLAGAIVPYQSFAANEAIVKLFFKAGDPSSLQGAIDSLYHFGDDGSGGDVIAEAGEYPLLWTFASLYQPRNRGDENYPGLIQEDTTFAAFGAKFLRQLSSRMSEDDIVARIEKTLFLMDDSLDIHTFYSPDLLRLSKRQWPREFYQFCDLVLFHQIKELLIRQLAVPYHYNTRESRRWVYRAKQHEMYLDLTVLDECRYAYDWMPSLDLLGNGMDDLQRQLVFRFALDGIGKHGRWYTSEYFRGTAIVGQFTKSFEAIELTPRTVLK